jgi:hypothetical protein
MNARDIHNHLHFAGPFWPGPLRHRMVAKTYNSICLLQTGWQGLDRAGPELLSFGREYAFSSSNVS